MCSFYTLETKLKLLNNSQIYIPLPSVALTSMHVRCAPKANIDAKLKQCMPLTIHVFIPNYGKFQIPKLFLMKEFYQVTKICIINWIFSVKRKKNVRAINY